MTSIEWRNRPELRGAAERLLEDPHLKIMLDIMRDEAPISRPLPAIGSSADDKAMAYGIQLGWIACLKKLQTFREAFKVPQQIESSFGVPEQDASTKPRK